MISFLDFKGPLHNVEIVTIAEQWQDVMVKWIEDYAELLMGSWAYLRYDPKTKEKICHVWFSSGINSWPWPMEHSKQQYLSHWDATWLSSYWICWWHCDHNCGSEGKGFKLATEKTELIFLTKKKCITLEICITICGTTPTTRKVVNCLDIRLDPRLTSHRWSYTEQTQIDVGHNRLYSALRQWSLGRRIEGRLQIKNFITSVANGCT